MTNRKKKMGDNSSMMIFILVIFLPLCSRKSFCLQDQQPCLCMTQGEMVNIFSHPIWPQSLFHVCGKM